MVCPRCIAYNATEVIYIQNDPSIMTHHVAVPLQGFVSVPVSVTQVAQAHVPLLQELLSHVTYLPAPVQRSAD